jgi:hypothetical protein
MARYGWRRPSAIIKGVEWQTLMREADFVCLSKHMVLFSQKH